MPLESLIAGVWPDELADDPSRSTIRPEWDDDEHHDEDDDFERRRFEPPTDEDGG